MAITIRTSMRVKPWCLRMGNKPPETHFTFAKSLRHTRGETVDKIILRFILIIIPFTYQFCTLAMNNYSPLSLRRSCFWSCRERKSSPEDGVCSNDRNGHIILRIGSELPWSEFSPRDSITALSGRNCVIVDSFKPPIDDPHSHSYCASRLEVSTQVNSPLHEDSSIGRSGFWIPIGPTLGPCVRSAQDECGKGENHSRSLHVGAPQMHEELGSNSLTTVQTESPDSDHLATWATM